MTSSFSGIYRTGGFNYFIRMTVTLPLAQMTVAEKLQAMEQLWADLSRDENFESPAWHETVLRERAGQNDFVDWEIAKGKLRARLK